MRPATGARRQPVDSGMHSACRRPLRPVAGLALALALAAPVARGAALPLPATEPIPAADPTLEAALLDATNAARARFGAKPLAQDEGLARAAREHASEMARLSYFSHGSPLSAHATLQKRLALAGSPLVDVAENLVLLGESSGNAADAQKAVRDWLNSPHHRENLLNRSYDRVGFGTARNAEGELFVVQDFGAQPVTLLDASAAHAQRSVSEVHVRVDASRALSALFTLEGSPQQTRDLPAGSSTVVLSTGASGSVALAVGVSTGGSSYLIDDAGTVDLARGSFREDAGQPRQQLRIAGVTVQRRSEQGARLTLAYTAPASARLALFLQGSYQPTSQTSPGHFELFLPDTLGVATVSVGVDEGGGNVSIVHRFHIDPSAALPRLLAGAGPAP